MLFAPRALALVVVFLASVVTACGSAVAPPSSVGCHTDDRPGCSAGDPVSGLCSDVEVQATCVDDVWQCPASTIPTTQCHCFGGAAQGCVCGASGWHCDSGDAGPPATACAGSASVCLYGQGHACGDTGVTATCVTNAWTCPAGTLPEEQCWCRLDGLHSGCTCTPGGWSCTTQDGGTTSPPCAGPAVECIGGQGHVCSDYGVSSTCVAGAWTCPADSVPESQCWCDDRGQHDGCACTAGGWVCPGDDASTFACGDTRCAVGNQVCYIGQPGNPSAAPFCASAPATCRPARCSCFGESPTSSCRVTDEGGVIIETPAI